MNELGIRLLRLLVLFVPCVLATLLGAMLLVEPGLSHQTTETLLPSLRKSSFYWLNLVPLFNVYLGVLRPHYVPLGERMTFYDHVGLQWRAGVTLALCLLLGAGLYSLGAVFLPHLLPDVYGAGSSWPHKVLAWGGGVYAYWFWFRRGATTPTAASQEIGPGRINAYQPLHAFVERVKAGDPVATASAWGPLRAYPGGRTIGGGPLELDPGHLSFGGLSLDASFFDPHFAFIGITGSGKSISMAGLIRSALMWEIGADGKEHIANRAVMYDATRTLMPQLLQMGVPAERITLCNPFDTRGSAWHMAGDMVARVTAEQFAELLIPDVRGSTDKGFWAEAPRLCVKTVIENFHEVAPGNWYLNDVLQAFANLDSMRRVFLLTEHGRNLWATFFDNAAADMSAGLLATLATKLSRFDTVASLWRRLPPEQSFTLHQWQTSRSVLVLGAAPEGKREGDALIRTLFHRMSQIVLTEKSKVGETWVVVDEVQLAGELDGLADLLIASRANGAHVVLGFQDLNGMQHVYSKDLALALINMCGNRAYLRLESEETSRWAAESFGKFKYLKKSFGESTSTGSSGSNTSTNTSQSVNYTEEEELHVKPAEFGRMQKPSEAYGMDGLFRVPGIGGWRGPIPGATINAARFAPGCKEIDVDGFEPRDASEQDRVPWGRADLERLKLTRPPEAPPSPRTGLRIPKGEA